MKAIAYLLLSAAIFGIFSSHACYATADIVVTSRTSRAFFDVLSGVGPRSNRLRETPAVEEGLTAPFAYNFSHSGIEMFDNGSIAGTASATGSYDHAVDIEWASELLDVNYLGEIAGEATSFGDGSAFADMRAEMTLEFTVDVPTDYVFDLQISNQFGDAESTFTLRHTDIGTNLHSINTFGDHYFEGTLAAGNYRLIANSIGSDFDDQSSMASDAVFQFQVGTGVPEPSGGLVLCSLAGIVAVRRRRSCSILDS
ncbi:PEP-CTERM sorting domain-containing protein [Mariniblastus fucicola]|uniref:PEP-CTERM protein-sorting domain-containing protein n=1 Tax=Mariniblastus fucicola TaxID=980251 RepID=A0A5B9PJI6_9BACT|nr:PEP-CTERM sorting domain-containing protein [Mariniblastus fucicola]QEG22811.1 hypothetical protein MFFC18_26960 [Mariniblastus fucicola]